MKIQHPTLPGVVKTLRDDQDVSEWVAAGWIAASPPRPKPRPRPVKASKSK